MIVNQNNICRGNLRFKASKVTAEWLEFQVKLKRFGIIGRWGE